MGVGGGRDSGASYAVQGLDEILNQASTSCQFVGNIGNKEMRQTAPRECRQQGSSVEHTGEQILVLERVSYGGKGVEGNL